jgi:hypothetical protein
MLHLPFRDVATVLLGFFQLTNMLQTGFYHVAVVILWCYVKLFEMSQVVIYDVAISFWSRVYLFFFGDVAIVALKMSHIWFVDVVLMIWPMENFYQHKFEYCM